jgi:hypothetical protein
MNHGSLKRNVVGTDLILPEAQCHLNQLHLSRTNIVGTDFILLEAKRHWNRLFDSRNETSF